MSTNICSVTRAYDGVTFACNLDAGHFYDHMARCEYRDVLVSAYWADGEPIDIRIVGRVHGAPVTAVRDLAARLRLQGEDNHA